MEKDKLLELFDKIILISVTIICGIVIFLGLMGKETVFGWTINYAYISSVFLCAITSHYIFSIFGTFGQRQIENKIDKSVSNIVESLNGVEKTTFNTIKEVDIYVASKIRNAKYSVQDLNWQDFRTPSSSHSQQHRLELDDEIDESINSFCKRKRSEQLKRKSIYEEIFTFPPSNRRNLQKMKSHIKNGDVYSCYYYETLEELRFPKLQFVIIDTEEIIFVSSEYKENFCAVKDRRIVNICSNYFMQARELSTIIKQKNHQADQNLINQIEAKYKLE
ncbi:MAG: hypothetical protein IPK88_12920 [Saprospiraceae bacterium]|nr:hypothetical protein [Candidatus Defluviibacterium haderslevense]